MVCSTHVEMFPPLRSWRQVRTCMLHARGDVSELCKISRRYGRYAPRTWRCFQCRHTDSHGIHVCSTHVEMFPHDQISEWIHRGMLHARGDVSTASYITFLDKASAPRTWRCFYLCRQSSMDGGVCSTHVEMFLVLLCQMQMASCMLHARGDVSELNHDWEGGC